MGANRSVGRWVLYFGCLAATLGAFGYYALDYIPRQREYFLNLRFRALAVLGDQFRSKVTNLAHSIEHARSNERFSSYIRTVVRDLALTCGDARAASPAPIDLDVVRFDAPSCTATAHISKILARSVNDDLFDDILIADSAGRVVYQYAVSSPRIVSLTELSKRIADPKSPVVEGSGVDADGVRMIRLDGSEYVLLLQPLTIAAVGTALKPLTVMVAGLARSDRLAAEARHVAPKHLLLIFAPLILVLLSGPFLKILLLTRTGRLAFHDMVLLALFTMFAAALTSIVLVSWQDYNLSAERTDPQMSRFADTLETAIVSDLRLMRNTLDAFDSALPLDLTQRAKRYQEDVWTSPDFRRVAARYTPLDFVFWTNADGCQAVKWSTKVQSTELVDQTPEEHFQSVLAGAPFALDDAPARRFALQARISPTTSQLIVIMDASSSRHDPIAGCDQPVKSPLVSVAMVGPIPSLDAPLVAPGAGFAIFDSGGKVIFHSVPERNLHENLFEEMRQPAPWRAAIAMRSEKSGAAYYRGRKYDFYVRPFRRLTGSSWNIATFREIEPEQAVIGLVWFETLILYFGLLAILSAGFGLGFLIARARFGLSWQKQRDFLLARFWPHPHRRKLYQSIAGQLASLSALAFGAELFAARDPLRWAGWLLPFLLLTTVGTITLIAFRLWRLKAAPWTGPITPVAQPAYIACLALLVVLLAIVPTAGLFRICQGFESRLYLMHWQQELANDFEDRQLQRGSDLRSSPSYSAEAKNFLLSDAAAPEGPDHVWARPKHLEPFWGTTLTATATADDWQPAWWERLLTVARPEAQVDAVEPGVLVGRDPSSGGPPAPCRWLQGQQGRWILRCENNSAARIEIASVGMQSGIPSNPLWWLCVVILLGGAYGWYSLAFRRLFVLELRYNPLPPLALENPEDEEKHLILLGLPLSHKDKAVRDWLHRTPPRVNLYEQHFYQYWTDETLSRIESELRPKAAFAASASGSSSTATPAPLWVHISNLETKLRDPDDRKVLAGLFEKLLTMTIGERRVHLIVTSAVDPVFHFDSVLHEGREVTFETPLSDHEVQRFARILHNFRKVTADMPPNVAPAGNSTVSDECGSQESLLAVGKEVASAAHTVEPDDLLPLIAERSRALYKLYWSTCTRSEKLLLIQLAQTGFVNPHCVDTLEVLMRKGLVLPDPHPRIMNETFRNFLTTVESRETVRKWECEGGESSWTVIRNIALVLAVVGLAVLALTQNQAMQTITAAVTGIGAAVAGVLRLVGILGPRRSAASESA